MKRPIILILGLVVVVGLIYAAAQARSTDAETAGSVGTAGAALATVEPDLDEVRAATERFKDVNVALAEGYVADPGNLCDTAEMMGQPAELGAMGIHYFRPDLLGLTATEPRVDGTSTHIDFTQPSVLIYEPQADGSLTLVAVENLVFVKAWEAAGHTAPPSFQGVVFDHMVDDPATPLDEAHMFEAHYDRHVWVHRENPSGVFAQYNPNVTCPATAQTHAH